MRDLSRSEFVGLIGTVAGTLAASPLLAAANEKRTFAVATDLHYISQSLTDNGPDFTELVSSADGKVMLKIEALVDAFVAEMLELAPDALVISGDLSFNGELASHEDLAEKLSVLVDAGIRVAVIPGNHDIDYPFAARFEGDAHTSAPNCSAEEFRRIWERFGYSDSLAEDPASLSYLYPLYEDFWLLMVDCNATSDPGGMTPETLSWCARMLARAAEEGVRVVSVAHQNLLCHCALFGDGFQIVGAPDLEALLSDCGVRMNLSGHIHVQHIAQSEQTALIDVATSSLAVTPNQYALISLEGGTFSYATRPVDVAAWAARIGSDDPDLLDFAAYAEYFFKNCSRVQCAGELEAVGFTPEDAAASSAAVSEMNRLYFAGRTDLIDWADPALQRTFGKTSLEAYLQFVRNEPSADHTRLAMDL